VVYLSERESLCAIKVGGSLLKDGKSYLEAAKNIKKFVDEGLLPVVVVSAAKGVTDALLEVTRGAAEKLGKVFDLYMGIATELGSQKVYKRVLEELELLKRITNSVIEGYDPVLQDLILSFGERISKVLMVEALEAMGVRALELNARELIITNDVHGDATIDYVTTANHLEKLVNSIISTAAVPVIEGFIGATEDGRVTTLGRGGSDYTATTIAALLRLNDVYLVTEVDGIMTADPSVIPTARIVKVMSYREAMEAALHGAKRINPKAFEPLEKFYGSVVHIGSWKLFGTKIVQAIPKEHRGPKVMMHRSLHEMPYIAIIGEGVSDTSFIKKVIDILYEQGVEIMGLQTYYYRPSIIMHVKKGSEVSTLKLLHKKVFEEVD
jgi:aspartate kinase